MMGKFLTLSSKQLLSSTFRTVKASKNIDTHPTWYFSDLLNEVLEYSAIALGKERQKYVQIMQIFIC